MTAMWQDFTRLPEPSSALATLGLTFVTPALAVAGAAAVAIPIIIHLLTRRRRTPIAWGAMRFLLEAYRKHRRRLTLEQLLLLACRCLVVMLLGLALSRPMLGDEADSRGATHLILLIDNSLTSQVQEIIDPQGRTSRVALDRFKDEAGKLLAELDSSRGDRASVMTLASPAMEAVWPASPDLGAVARVIQDIRAEDSRADMAGAVAAVRARLLERENESGQGGPRPRVVIALMSELRAGSADLSQPLDSIGSGPGSPILKVLPAPSQPMDNTAITAVDPVRPLMTVTDAAEEAVGSPGNQARVTLERFGPWVSRAGATSVRVLLTDPRTPPIGESPAVMVPWQPGQRSATVIVDVAPGPPGAEALALTALIDPDAIASDNIRVRSVEARRGVRVAVIDSLRIVAPPSTSIDRFTPGDWVRLVLRPQGPSVGLGVAAGLTPTTMDPASLARGGLGGFDAAIILAPDELTEAGWMRIAEFLGSGGMVLVTPPAEASVHVWGETMAAALGLDWTIGREAVTYGEPVGVAGEVSGGASNTLLGMISGEMQGLARPVSVMRRIEVRVGEGMPPPVLGLSDGAALLVASEVGSAGSMTEGRGMVALLTCAIDLAWSDLPTKPLMLPLLHETVRVGVGVSQVMHDRIAGRTGRVPAGTTDLVPVDSRAREAGTWSPAAASVSRVSGVWRAVGAGGSTISLLAVNPDTAGSDTDVVLSEQTAAWLGTIVGSERVTVITEPADNRGPRAVSGVAAGGEGETIGVPLLIAALCLALVEVFLARRFSHAETAVAAGESGAGA